MKARIALVSLAALLIGAHFLRRGQYLFVLLSLDLPFLLLLFRRRWSLRLVQGGLVLAALIWLHTLYLIVQERIAIGRAWGASAVILGSVVLVTLLAAWLLNRPDALERYPAGE